MAKKIIIFLAILVLLMAVYSRPFSKLKELNMKNKALGEEIKYLKNINRVLQGEVDRLERDLDYVEKRAREKIGVVKEGEIIYKINPGE